MSAGEYNTGDMPGVPEPLEEESTPGFPNDNDPSPFKKFYVAIDGVDKTDFTDDELKTLRGMIIDTLVLDMDKEITGVRMVSDDKNVVEVDDA